MRKKERFVLGKRTFRSQKSKHFVLRIIWVELVDNGFNRLVGSNQAMIEDTYALLVDAPKTGFENRLYGNGDAGNKILESLQLL